MPIIKNIEWIIHEKKRFMKIQQNTRLYMYSPPPPPDH